MSQDFCILKAPTNRELGKGKEGFRVEDVFIRVVEERDVSSYIRLVLARWLVYYKC